MIIASNPKSRHMFLNNMSTIPQACVVDIIPFDPEPRGEWRIKKQALEMPVCRRKTIPFADIRLQPEVACRQMVLSLFEYAHPAIFLDSLFYQLFGRKPGEFIEVT